MQIHQKSRPGFTIVEMLVVIGIIAVLIGLLLPALSSAQARGMKMREMNAIRQVGTAWMLYSNQNRETILPGYLEHDPGAEDVQDVWRTQYEYPVAPLSDPNNPNSDTMSRVIPPEIAAPWPWRLLNFLDYDYNTLLGYRHDDEQTQLALVNEAEIVAYEPAFGYNGYYVGGWLEVNAASGSQSVAPRFWNVRDADTDERVTVVHTRQSSLRQPDETVAFCTASEFESGDTVGLRGLDANVPGSHLVTPQYLAEELQWTIGAGTDVNYINAHGSPTHAPIGRYNLEVVFLYADGSVGTGRHNDLLGQAKWIDGINDPEFTHTDDE